MDETRFDGLIRTLGQGQTRRGALGVLAGLAGLSLGEVAARRRHRKKQGRKQRARASAAKPPKCTATKTSNSACAKFCASTFGAGTPEAGRCTSDATRCQGPCYQCGPGCGDACRQALCGTTCTTLGTDTNCSACGDTCADGKTCQGGTCSCTTIACPAGQQWDPETCQCVCPSGTTECGGQCVDTHTDANHCGSCDTACGSGRVCRSSACFTSCTTNSGCFGTSECPRGSTTGACAGTADGTLVCIAINEYDIDCTTDAECEAYFGAGHVCLTDVASGEACDYARNHCAYW